MPRYLTPLRISLLVLTDIWISGAAPASAELEVAAFIAAQTIPSSDLDQRRSEQRFELASFDITVLGAYVSKWPSNIPGRTLYDVLLQRLWKMDGVDSLHGLFSHIVSLVAQASPEPQDDSSAGKISRGSPLGQYIRRCHLEFIRLQFDDTIALYRIFEAYRRPSHDIWASRNRDAALSFTNEPRVSSSGSVIESGSSDQTTYNYASADDADTLLSLSIQNLQKLGTRVPPELRSRLGLWVDKQWEVNAQSLHYFMSFFEHWRAGSYNMALESLHQYFDYFVPTAKSGSENVKAYYQYALLHQSVLQADFEHWEESIASMEECIAIARENQDTACLNFATSWKLYLTSAHRSGTDGHLDAIGGNPSDEKEIALLKKNARESKHWSLYSSTLLEEAKIELSKATGSIGRAIEHVMESAHLNVVHDLRPLMPSTALFERACFDRLGLTNLSASIFDIVTLTHHSHCSMSDLVRLGCRAAYALCQRGEYADAIKILHGLRNSECDRVLLQSQRILAFTYLVRLRQAIHVDPATTARMLLDTLRPIQASGDPEIVFEIFVTEIQLLIKRKDYVTALEKINACLTGWKRDGTVYSPDSVSRLRLIVLKCKIFVAQPSSAPQAFSTILRVAVAASEQCLMPIFIDATAVLCEILNGLREFEAVRDMTTSALARAHTIEDPELVARLYRLLADAHWGISRDRCQNNWNEETRNHDLCQDYLDLAIKASKVIQDIGGQKEAFIRKELANRNRGYEGAAREAAAKYLELDEQPVKFDVLV